MPTAPVNGIEVLYERRGEGARVRFLNGPGSTLEASELLLAPFRAATLSDVPDLLEAT